MFYDGKILMMMHKSTMRCCTDKFDFHFRAAVVVCILYCWTRSTSKAKERHELKETRRRRLRRRRIGEKDEKTEVASQWKCL